MSDHFQIIPAIFAAVFKDGKVLLLRRKNTKWLDGYYDLPAGHLEEKETLQEGALRELREETSLTADPQDLDLISLYQNYNNKDKPYIGFMFLVKRWKGEPKIMEPFRCDDMGFFSLNNLPKLTPYVEQALKNLDLNKVSFSYHGEGEITG